MRKLIYKDEAYKAIDNCIHDSWDRISPSEAKSNIYHLVSDADEIDRPQGWTLCSEGLPEACQNVQLTCEVRPVGREPSRYVCIAQWIPRFCQEALSVNWDAEVTEYCEEDDEYYPLEGWYEFIRNWDDYSLVGIADFAIAWKPLEEPYKGAE